MIPLLEDTVSHEDLAVRDRKSINFTFAAQTIQCRAKVFTLQLHGVIRLSLQRYEYAFNKTNTPKSKFDYALCLMRSQYKADMKKSVLLLNELLATDEYNERDYLFHLAVVHTRLHEYIEAEQFVQRLWMAEPNNSQVATLKAVIQEKKLSQTVSDVATLSVFSAVIGMALFVIFK